jgi:hypothetical protein
MYDLVAPRGRGSHLRAKPADVRRTAGSSAPLGAAPGTAGYRHPRHSAAVRRLMPELLAHSLRVGGDGVLKAAL